MGLLSGISKFGEFLTPERVQALGAFGEALSEPGTPGARLGRAAQTLSEGTEFNKALRALRGSTEITPLSGGEPLAGQVRKVGGAPAPIDVIGPPTAVSLPTAADAAVALAGIDFSGLSPEHGLAISNLFLSQISTRQTAELAERRETGVSASREAQTALTRKTTGFLESPEQKRAGQVGVSAETTKQATAGRIEVAERQASLDVWKTIEIDRLGGGPAGPSSAKQAGEVRALQGGLLTDAMKGIVFTPELQLLNPNAQNEALAQFETNILASLSGLRQANIDPELMQALEVFAAERIKSMRDNPQNLYVDIEAAEEAAPALETVRETFRLRTEGQTPEQILQSAIDRLAEVGAL